jgi:DNA-binding transcriptional LysR family regulator
VVGRTLVARGKGGSIELTAHGTALAERGRALLALNDDILKVVQTQPAHAAVRLGVDSGYLRRLPDIVAERLPRAPASPRKVPRPSTMREAWPMPGRRRPRAVTAPQRPVAAADSVTCRSSANWRSLTNRSRGSSRCRFASPPPAAPRPLLNQMTVVVAISNPRNYPTRSAAPCEHLNLPAVAEVEQTIEIGPDRYHVRKIGDVLHAERESRATLDLIKAGMGSATFAAQYQQTPVPPGGNMIKWEWFKWYDDDDLEIDDVVISWDTAMKPTEFADYSVGTVWGVKGDFYYLLDVIRERPAEMPGRA